MRPFDNLAGDVRHALRTLVRERAFSLTALLTFALCLGANVALFAVVNAVLLRPLPFPEADRLVEVSNSYPKAGVTDSIGVSVLHYLERRAGIEVFAETAAYQGGGATIGEAGSPDRVDAMSVTPSFFPVLGVSPVLGRAFTEEEGEPGKHHVVVLSDGLWRRKFGADPNVVGHNLRLGGDRVATIIGVMPPDFSFLTSKAQLWTPLTFSDDDRRPQQRHSNNMRMIARLKPDATLATAKSQIDAQNAANLAIDPYAKLITEAGFTTDVKDLHDSTVSRLRPVLLLLQAGVLLLLLIGAVNLANLMLVRGSARAKDFSIRQVLGAGRGRIARQLLTESMVLAFAGAVLGLGLGWVCLRGLNQFGADDLPRSGDLQLNGLVCAVAFGVALITGVLLALPVIWHNLHGNLALALAVESRGGTTSRATHRLRHTLIAAQFSLAFVLLAGAGLLGLSFSRVLAVAPGFNPEQVLSGMVSLPDGAYQKSEQRVAFLRRLGDELRNEPGVAAVGFGTSIPFGAFISVNGITVSGHEPKPGESLKAHYTTGVTGDYFSALGIPLREGRFLNADDTARGDRVCVVDEEFARYYWPGGGALGHQIFNGIPEEGEKPFVIVGVVGAIKQTDLADERPRGAIYLPYVHYASHDLAVVLRSALAPASSGPALRSAVLRIDPNLPVTDLQTFSHRIDDSLQGRRAPMLLAALFAGLALVLAAVGLYGVLAYAVAQRRREIGVRMALGAGPGQIRAQFLSLGVRLVAVGIALGSLGAWFSGQAMESLLFGVSPVHLGVLIAAATVLSGIALAACLLPAMRAARVPPMEALRSD